MIQITPEKWTKCNNTQASNEATPSCQMGSLGNYSKNGFGNYYRPDERAGSAHFVR